MPQASPLYALPPNRLSGRHARIQAVSECAVSLDFAVTHGAAFLFNYSAISRRSMTGL